MFKNKPLILLAVLGIFMATACNSSSKSTADKKNDESKAPKTNNLTITTADDGKTINLKVNQKFDATFNECVGCRDIWRITEIDKTAISYNSGDDTYADKSCENCTGGNHNRTFHFKATKAGKSTLAFSYFEETITVQLVVE